MLSPEEKKEIDRELELYEVRRGACIDALRIVQKHRGWVSDDAVREIAEYLGMSPSQVDDTATFYNLIYRKPVGKNVILLCDSVSCWVCGYEAIRKKIEDSLGIRYGETTKDGKFTLLPIACLGTCDHAPAMMINGDLHRDLDPDGLGAILENYRKNGKA